VQLSFTDPGQTRLSHVHCTPPETEEKRTCTADGCLGSCETTGYCYKVIKRNDTHLTKKFSCYEPEGGGYIKNRLPFHCEMRKNQDWYTQGCCSSDYCNANMSLDTSHMFTMPEGEEGDQHLLMVLAISVPVLVVLVIVLILVLLYRQCFPRLGYTMVYWELAMRTNLPGVETSEYLMPYHDQVNPDPTIEEMRAVVCDQKVRPELLGAWEEDTQLRCLAKVMHECWFENTLARLSALRIKKNLTEIQAEDSGVGDE